MNTYGIPPQSDDMVTSVNGVPLTRNDFHRLNNGQEYNDNNIDFYFQLIVERAKEKSETMPKVHAFATYWWQVNRGGFDVHLARWTKNVTLSDFDILLFPINRHHHWSLVVVDQRTKILEYFDPLKLNDNGATDAVRDYLINERHHYTGLLLPKSHWQISIFDKFIRQNNGIDCGAYVCAFAKWRTNGFTITPAEVSDFRSQMKNELSNGVIE